MPPTIASAPLTDEAFLASFHRCSLPLAMFRHGDHLRFAWLTLRRHGLPDSLTLVKQGIQRFAAHYGVSHIFHETVTAAWVHLLATHTEPTFAAFHAENESRLNHTLLHRFWTPETLDSPAARHHWVPPDRAPLPTRPA